MLYVGRARLLMASEFQANDEFLFRYRIVDIRDVDADLLLNSDGIGDNVLSVLTRLRNKRKAMRQIVSRIAELDEAGQSSLFEQLSMVAGLRGLEPLVKEETGQMPITEDILKHQFIGPAYRQGREEGRQSELRLVLRLITKRFGQIPASLDERLSRSSVDELEAIAERILDAASLEELLK